MAQTKGCPKEYHTLTPALTTKDAGKAIDFYKRAFGAEERMRFPGPDGKGIMHAEIKIGDSVIMLGEEHPEMGCVGPQKLGGTPVDLYLYVEDADRTFKQAVSAGAKSETAGFRHVLGGSLRNADRSVRPQMDGRDP